MLKRLSTSRDEFAIDFLLVSAYFKNQTKFAYDIASNDETASYTKYFVLS